MTIHAKWYGQDCTVEAMTTYDSMPVFLVAALPGQAFCDGSVLFTAYKHELSDIEWEPTPAGEALGAWIDAMNDVDRLADNDMRPQVAAAIKIENLAHAAYLATLS